MALAVAVPAFALLWVGGVVSYWRGGSRPEEAWLASVFLALAGLIVLLGARTTRGALALFAVALFGLALAATVGFALCAAQLILAFRARTLEETRG